MISASSRPVNNEPASHFKNPIMDYWKIEPTSHSKNTANGLFVDLNYTILMADDV